MLLGLRPLRIISEYTMATADVASSVALCGVADAVARGANAVFLQAELANMRVKLAGDVTAATGQVLYAFDQPSYLTPADLAAIRVIRETGNARINIVFVFDENLRAR